LVKTVTVSLLPSQAADAVVVLQQIAIAAGAGAKRITKCDIIKKSLDARSRQPKFIITATVYIDEQPKPVQAFAPVLNNVMGAEPVIIAGAGPAGLFAALQLIACGIKPIILERGKDVRARRRDIAALNKTGILNPESNYCFGEGGAGTYSDGKLYTRSTKRGDVQHILQLLHFFGAPPEILYETHPHIGTNKLPGIITAIREQIIECGGELIFNAKLTDILLPNGEICGATLADGTLISARHLILATGHSASDIFELLHAKDIAIAAKPFALGVRAEHPQQLIDSIQYHCPVKEPLLPPATYSLVSQELGRGVFSFCMCPGGIIAPASTAQNEVVVNGWSPSKRNNPHANSGIVVAVDEKDFAAYGFTGALAGLRYRQMIEKKAFSAGGGNQAAPAQRLADFISGVQSATLPLCSYHPGIVSQPIDKVLPQNVAQVLRAGLVAFGKKMKGYATNEAVLVATESRTSSPVTIPREKDSFCHPQIKGLYPCGEGAGYAGGIVSAAMDGMNVARAIAAISFRR
jgi:uncharacterized protein